MATMDDKVVSSLFLAMGQVSPTSCGIFRVDAGNPEGIQGIVVLAIDAGMWVDVEEMLGAIGMDVTEIKREAKP